MGERHRLGIQVAHGRLVGVAGHYVRIAHLPPFKGKNQQRRTNCASALNMTKRVVVNEEKAYCYIVDGKLE